MPYLCVPSRKDGGVRRTWDYRHKQCWYVAPGLAQAKKYAGVPHLHVPSQKKTLGCRICAFIIKNADMPYLQEPSQKKTLVSYERNVGKWLYCRSTCNWCFQTLENQSECN